MKSLVIFDLDGTLLNTIEDLGMAANYALREMKYPEHGLEAYPTMVGNGVRKLIERALPQECVTPRVVDTMLELFMQYYDEHCCDATKPYPGIPELLEHLTQAGVNLAVTSNKYQSAVTKIIANYFPEANWKAVLGNTPELPRKPDPSIVFMALSHCPTPKRDVLYVGDSGVDIETARRACVESVGVTWGFRPKAELIKSYADHIVGVPDEIMTLALE